MAQIREAELPAYLDAVQRLWLAYLTWGNDGLEDRYGFRLPIGGFVERDRAKLTTGIVSRLFLGDSGCSVTTLRLRWWYGGARRTART